jgi:hypothetical protein
LLYLSGLLAAAPAVVLELEAYAIGFFERANASGLERARVNKDILSAVVRFDEAEPGCSTGARHPASVSHIASRMREAVTHALQASSR